MTQKSPRYISTRNLKWSMMFIAILVIFYGIVFSVNSWNEEKRHRMSELGTIVELGEKSIDSFFLQLESDLRLLARDWEAGYVNISSAQHSERMQRLRYFKQLHPELTNVAVIGVDGKFLDVVVVPKDKPLPSLAGTETWKLFLEEVSPQAQTILGRPTLSPITGEWILPMRHMVYDSTQQPVVVVAATFNVEMLHKFWKGAPVVDVASIGLLRDDGFLYSRFPNPKNVPIVDVYGKPRTGALINHLKENAFPKEGELAGESSLNGPGQFISFRRLNHFPVTLFVTLPQTIVWNDWWNRTKFSLLITLLFFFIGTLTYVVSQKRQILWQEERERLDRLKSEFISVVSHELRTPVTSIRGSLGLLEAGVLGELPPAAANLVSVAHRNSQRLGILINDILDMEKLMLGNVTLNIEPLNFSKSVQAAIEANIGYANTFSVSFEFTAPDEEIRVLADQNRLMQVLSNLLSNAAKFSPTGAKVDIRLHALPNAPAKYKLEIQDVGKGIAAGFRERIFTPFAQENTGDTRSQGGTGLGLNISKTLIEKMQGEIGFESEEGQGSTFWIVLNKA
jgi:signal transduction histidine kinase